MRAGGAKRRGRMVFMAVPLAGQHRGPVGLPAEFGVTVAQSPEALRLALPALIEDASNEVPGIARLALQRAGSTLICKLPGATSALQPMCAVRSVRPRPRRCWVSGR